jgi:hypothetical protein
MLGLLNTNEDYGSLLLSIIIKRSSLAPEFISLRVRKYIVVCRPVTRQRPWDYAVIEQPLLGNGSVNNGRF